MFYFIHGTDTARAIEKAKSLIDSLVQKKPNASIFKLTTDNWDISHFQEFLAGQALFENKYIVYLSRIMENKDIAEIVLGTLEEIKESENVFIWVEDAVDAKDLKNIEKFATKVQEFQEKEIVKKNEFNVFSLSEALGNRDKKKLWLLFQEAKEHLAVEEIYGNLFWQLKSMMIAYKVKTAEEADMKSFPFNKAKAFNKNYSKSEVEKMISKLISVYHNSRRGIHDFEIALERFCLEV